MLATAIAIWFSDGRPVFYCRSDCAVQRPIGSPTMYDAEMMAVRDRRGPARCRSGASQACASTSSAALNVLRGDEPRGPRPERPVFLSELKALPLFALRELVKPGLTGAQLKYRYGSTMEEQACKLQYDLLHQNAAVPRSVCLLATSKVVLLGKGAR
jgi:lipopolysaccharide/colanic/teichoic acid biosynthesis glycosyltransferase